MNELTKTKTYLPANLKELTKFVLIGREKLVAIKAHIRAIDKLGLAKDVRDQKKEEATMLAGALLDAEVKMGELIKDMPKENSYKGLPNSGGRKPMLPEGISHNQSSKFQSMASYPAIVEQVKAEAIENDDLPTRTEVLKRIKEKERESEIKPTSSLPEGKYDVIVIDPPWAYGTKYDSENRRVASPYEEMDLESLKKIKLPISDNAVLWLWTTHKFIWDAKTLLEHWGFDYKILLVWDKEKLGLGAWLRCQVEFCLLGIKGKPQCWNLTNERDIIRESRREHSRKPKAFYEMVKKLCKGKRIDMFSREERDGFDRWGNETEKF